MPQVLGRLPDGRLAFGLCRSCLEHERGEVMAVGPMGGGRRRWFRNTAGRPVAAVRGRQPGRPCDRRRRALLMTLAGLAAVGVLALAVVGLAQASPPPVLAIQDGGPHPFGASSAPVLAAQAGAGLHPFGAGVWSSFLAGLVGIVAFASALGLAVLVRKVRQVAVKVVQVGAMLAAPALLIWGIVQRDPLRVPLVVLLAVLALTVSMLTYRVEQRQGARPRSRPGPVL